MDAKLVKFSAELEKVFGSNMKSFILYGSAATGETFEHSDINTLLVLEKIDTTVLKPAAKTIKKWVDGGQPVPLIFTKESLVSSQDVFPVEFIDIKDNSRVIFGEAVFDSISIDLKNLRLEIEHELRSKLIRMRQMYLASGGDRGKIKILLIRSLSGFTALLKGIIRLYGKKAPVLKREVIAAAPQELALKADVFNEIMEIKEGKKKVSAEAADILFNRYMSEIERIASVIDAFKA
jgi:predicted nucleotidyltransferase